MIIHMLAFTDIDRLCQLPMNVERISPQQRQIIKKPPSILDFEKKLFKNNLFFFRPVCFRCSIDIRRFFEDWDEGR